ncbi:P-loop containing nucleoside triphosphate hydrolase protein [Meredithblackwellia eburnea MCA 4105]
MLVFQVPKLLFGSLESSTTTICSNDGTFGPVSNCRAFDFTITFEFFILSILPSALFILLASHEIFQLRKADPVIPPFKKQSFKAKVVYASKVALNLSFAATGLAALVSWTRSQDSVTTTDGGESLNPDIGTAAFALELVSSLIQLPLSHLTHFRTFRSSILLPFYLLSTVIFDVGRTRTFVLAGLATGDLTRRIFLGCWVSHLALRVATFVGENVERGWIIKESRREDEDPLSPEDTASFVSALFFHWATPLLLRGARSQLSINNLDPLSVELDCVRLYEHGKIRWDQEVAKGGKYPLVRTLLGAFPSAVLKPVAPCVVYSLAMIARPQLIHDAIVFIDSYTQRTNGSQPQPVENGWGLAVGFFLIYATYGVANSWWLLSVNRGATMLRGFLLEAIYRKSLKIHVEVAKQTGSGKAGSMMSLETEKVLLRWQNIYDPLAAVIIVFIGLIMLYKQIGLSFLSAIICVLFLFIATPPLSKPVGPAQQAWTELTDKRTKLTGSVLRNIVSVKLSAYTQPLMKKILALRDEETERCRLFWFQMLKMSLLTNISASLISLVTLGTYAVVTIVDPSVPPLTTARMFTVVSILATICQPLFTLGQGWASLVSAWTAIGRIQEFLLSEERVDATITPPPDASTDRSIVFTNASFGRGENIFLKDITTTIPDGKKTFIVGKVGSGKSTLLAACLSEVDLKAGNLTLPASQTAYCSQDAWLRTESIRKAILFASPYEEVWYRRVVRALSLDQDLNELPAGDATLAVKLSGGQRQRVALARAVYARPQRLVLDDVFSALDANTEDHVFEELFHPVNGILLGTTVIMATNGVHRLTHADHIIVLEEGIIAEQGSFSNLMAAKGLTFNLVNQFSSERHSAGVKGGEDEDSETPNETKENSEEIDDEGWRGSTPLNIYTFYLSKAGWFRLVLSLALTVVSQALPMVISIYQQYWSTSVGVDPRAGLKRYFGGYVGLQLLYFASFWLFVWYILCVVSPVATQRLHQILLTSVLAAPVVKLEKGGVGKLLNRFSSDVFELDLTLPNHVVNVTSLTVTVLGSTLIICITAPWITLIMLVVSILFWAIRRFYSGSSQQLRRLDIGSKTPLYNLLTDVINSDGIRTIRASHSQAYFCTLNTTFVSASQKPYYLTNVSRRWLSSIVNWSIALINFALVLIAVVSRNSTSAGLFAVALIQATSLTDSLNHLLLSWVEMEICIVAVERIKEYADIEPEEDVPEDPNSQALANVWPRQGGIFFENVTARYNPNLDPVLKNLSFKVRAGDRVGIVGRTGSGKSTTLAALFRLISLEPSGRIVIDGKNIAELPLDTVRRGMTLIPQDPLLLEMSIRDNLDVEGEKTDAEIWDALEGSEMKTTIESLPLKLDEMVTGAEGRFSRGQKQLLAMSRALLRGRSIVCLDEATSSLDVETDQAVQRTLRSSFGRATILTIAHRMGTIRDYDQILVLDNGRLAEQGSPSELLQIPGGLFRRLVMGDDVEENPLKQVTSS